MSRIRYLSIPLFVALGVRCVSASPASAALSPWASAGDQAANDRWPEAISIIVNGLLIVFFIMVLLSTITWLVGRIIQSTTKTSAADKAEKKE